MEKLKNALMSFLTIAVSVIFFYAGISKITNIQEFYASIESFQILTQSQSLVLAYFLPPMEMLLAIFLLLPRYKFSSSVILAGLVLGFIITICVSWMRDINISCGCFGGFERSTYRSILFRDLILLMVLMFIVLKSFRRSTGDGDK